MIILGLVHCSKKNATNPTVATVEDLILKDNEISGWVKAGNGWIANNESELFAKIDGGAEKYTKNGFVEGAGQDYQGKILNSQTTVTLRIFDQGTLTNSKKVFDEIVAGLSGAENWQGSSFIDAKVVRYSDSQIIVCWKSKYYVDLSIESNLNEALDLLKTFATNVGSKIK